MQSGAHDSSAGGGRPKAKLKKSRIPTVATPSDSESAEDDNISRIIDSDADFPDLVGSEPKNPFCESCRRAKMQEKRKYVGSYNNTATRWGQLVTGDHIVSTQDNIAWY